jgi:hypothetical protein
MGKSRSERRASSATLVNLYSTNTVLGWRVIDQVPIELALEKVALCKWRRVFYADGEAAGFQPLTETPARSVKVPFSLDGSPATITLAEVKMNAGLYGRSHTRGMPEFKRLTRHAKYDEKKILPPEDPIERAQEKVRLWPFPASVMGTDKDGEPIFGDRAIRVYPKQPNSRSTNE